jgi:hypothetical protein
MASFTKPRVLRPGALFLSGVSGRFLFEVAMVLRQ